MWLRFITFAILLLMARAGLAQSGPCTSNCVEMADLPPGGYGLSAEAITAYQPPQLGQLTVNPNLLHDRRYQQVIGQMTVHDAPGGNVIRTLSEGFNFVTINRQEGEWTEINAGEWVHSASLRDSNHVISRFTGVMLPPTLPEYTVAWMLKNAYASSYPGGPALETNTLYYRYTQVLLYDSYELDGWRWYQIGPDAWVHQTMVAKVLPVERPRGLKTWRWVSIDLYEQVMVAYEGKRPIFATLLASGLPRWPTEEGLFNIYYRRTRAHMSWGTPGDDFYALEEVPWTMFFDEGRALHGAYWHDGLGYRRSHGCVNLSITDAHWLYHWVAQDFETLNSPNRETGPGVYVYSSDAYR